jgi:hypothetical protein
MFYSLYSFLYNRFIYKKNNYTDYINYKTIKNGDHIEVKINQIV